MEIYKDGEVDLISLFLYLWDELCRAGKNNGLQYGAVYSTDDMSNDVFKDMMSIQIKLILTWRKIKKLGIEHLVLDHNPKMAKDIKLLEALYGGTLKQEIVDVQ